MWFRIFCPYLRGRSSFQSPMFFFNLGPRPNRSYHVPLFTFGWIFYCADGRGMPIPKHQYLTATPHDVTSQTTIILALTAVRTTYLTPYSRVAQTSHISRDNLKILGDGRGTRSGFKCERPQMLGVTVGTTTWHQELMHKFVL